MPLFLLSKIKIPVLKMFDFKAELRYYIQRKGQRQNMEEICQNLWSQAGVGF